MNRKVKKHESAQLTPTRLIPSRLSKRLRVFFHNFLVLWMVACMFLQGSTMQLLLADNITTTGQTRTTVTQSGANTTDIRTETTSKNGRNAYNSFGKFNVNSGHTANLYLPNGAVNLVNTIKNERSQIDGIVNSYKNGQIGGNVYFLNPHGIVIGAGGTVNVGSLHLQTPTSQYVQDLINANGEVSVIHEQQLFDGNVPLSPSGLISVKGKINALEEVQLKAGKVDIAQGASVRAGRQVQVEFKDIVKVNDTQYGNELLVTPEGVIKIVSSGDVNVAGKVSVDGVAGQKAGDIEISAGNNINVNTGANISAKGVGKNSDGGNVVIFADNDSNLAKNATVNVAAESGKGGFLEFSAKKTVNVTGNGLISSAGGTILIDPETVNWTGADSDVFTNGADKVIEATDSIKLTDVYISTRQVAGSGRTAHETGNSTGNSGDLTLKAPKITLTNSKLLAHATGSYIAGDVVINLKDNEWGNQFDYGGEAYVEFIMDASSKITGRHIKIEAIAATGTVVEDETELKGDEDKSKEFADQFEEMLDSVLDALETALSTVGNMNPLVGARDNHADAKITINGTIEASESVEITALAEAHAEFKSIGTVLTGSVAIVKADSLITIGGTAKITANGTSTASGAKTGVTINSTAETLINVGSIEIALVNAVPADVIFSVGVANSTNTINIVQGAAITSKRDIVIEALTNRSASLSTSGGSGDSYMGLSVAVMVGDSKTGLNVDGILNADHDIILAAKTDTEKNNLSATASMAKGHLSGVINASNNKTHVIDKAKGIWKFVKTLGHPEKAVDSADNSNDKFGVAGAISVLHDTVQTNVVVGATATLTAGQNIDISAETINRVVIAASSLIGPYDSNGEETRKDTAIAISAPIVFMDNSTNAVVKAGAELTANKAVNVTANTEIPFNLTHPIYDAITDFDPADIASIASLLMSQNLGVDTGFLNSWAQAASESDEVGFAGMASVQVIKNTTIAQIEGANIKGKDTSAKPDLNVKATTTVEQANLVGSFKSFFGRLPDMSAQEKFDGVFRNMWGTESGTSIGGAFLGSFIDNTTIARIDGGDLDVKNLVVEAATKSVDIGISIGGGKADGIGVNGMFGLTEYDSYTLAKIDDSVKVRAASVKINANDAAYRIGLAGGVVQGNTGVGLSGIVTLLEREAHAVWGNLLDKDGNLVKIKGDSNNETDATAAVDSIVTGNIDITSELSGLNIVAAVAGALTSQTSGETPGAPETPQVPALTEEKADMGATMQELLADPVDIFGFNLEEELPASEAKSGLGISGAVAVNVLTEYSTAGISGNVKITANDIKVEALNNILDIAVGGGITAQAGTAEKNTGIAGGFGVNILTGATIAYIQPKWNTDTNQIAFNNLTVNAKRGGQIISVTAGASGSSAKEGVQVAGSVSFNYLKDDTFTRVQNANLYKKAGTGNISINAEDSASIIAVAGGLAIGGDTGFGAAIAANKLELNTHANIDDSTIAAANLDLHAKNSSYIITIALAGAVTSGDAVGGTGAIVVSNSTTAVAISGSTINLTGYILADALSVAGIGSDYYDDLVALVQSEETNTDYTSDNGVVLDTSEDGTTASQKTDMKLGLAGRNPKIVTAALAVAVGKDLAVGANLSANILTDTTSVDVASSTITTTGNSTYNANTAGGIISVAVGVAAGTGGTGVAGNVAVNLVGGSTKTNLTGSTLTATNGTLTAQALNAAGIINIALNVAGGSSNGVAASFAYNQVAHSTSVNTNAILSGRAVTLNSLNSADIISALLSVGGGGTGGGGASLAINTVGKLTGREASDVSEGGDSSSKENEALGNIGTKFKAADFITTISNSSNVTEVNVTGGSITTTNGALNINATNSGKLVSIAVGLGFGGSTGVGVAASYNNISSGNNITVKNATLTITGGGVNVNSKSTSDIIGVVISGAGGGSVGVGVGAAVNVITGTNLVTFENNTATVSSGNVSLKADDLRKILAVSGAVAGGGTTGVGAAVAVNVIKGKTTASILGGTINVNSGSFTVNANNDSEILSVAAAGAGGGAVGVAGSVAINIIQGETIARIGDSNHAETNVNAKNGVTGSAKSTGDILAIGGGIAGAGAVGVSGSVSYNELGMDVAAEAVNAKINAKYNSGNSNFKLEALSEDEIKSILVNVAGAGIVAVGANNATKNIYGKTRAEVRASEITANDISVIANNTSKVFGVTVSAGGGAITAVNVATDVTLLARTVKAVVDASNLTASQDILIKAIDTKSVDSNIVGFAVSGIAGVGASISVVKTTGKTSIDILNTSKLTATRNLSLDADSVLNLKQLATTVAGGIAGVAIGVDVNVLRAVTEINTSTNTELTATNGYIDINATGTTTLTSIEAHSVGAGLAGVAGTVVVSVIEDAAKVNFRGKATASNGNFNLTAQSDVKQTASHVGAGGAGAVGVGSGTEVIVVKNSSVVNIATTGDGIIAKNVDLKSLANRDITSTTYGVGVGGFAGVGAAVSVINMGGLVDNDIAGMFSETLGAVNMQLGSNNNGNRKSTGDTIVDVDAVKAASSQEVAAITIAGKITATSNINTLAQVTNKVNQQVLGGGAGLVGIGAAVGVITSNDNVRTTVSSNAVLTAPKITISSLAKQQAIRQNVMAGGVGYYGLGAAVGVTNFSGDVVTLLGTNVVLDALTGTTTGTDGSYDIKLFAGREVTATDIDVSSAAVGAIGLSAAVQNTKFAGVSEVQIGDNSQVKASNIYLTVLDRYISLDSSTWGGSGGAFAGAGAVDNVEINGTSSVAIGNGVKIGIIDTNSNPSSVSDNINISARAQIDSLSSYSKMVGAGVAAAGDASANADVLLASFVEIGTAKLRSGNIILDAGADTNINVLSTSDTYGGAGLPFADSDLTLIELANIKLTGSDVESWNTLSASAGTGTNTINTLSYLYNYTAIPLNSSPDAVTSLNQTDNIQLSGAKLTSVGDIKLLANQQQNNVTTYSEGTNTYLATLEAIGDMFGADWSLSVKGGNTYTNFVNTIKFENASSLEAGSHYNSVVTIDANGNITHSPWITVDGTSSSQSIYSIFADRIAVLKERMVIAAAFGDYNVSDAYALEIQMLEQQLQYYVIPGKENLAIDNPARYGTANFINVTGTVTASSGDIIINGNVSTSGAASTLTAHSDPSITITNNSSKFLNLNATLEIPYRVGGRIFVKGNVVDTSNKASFGLNSATLQSIGTSGAVTDPVISIKNTRGGTGGNDLAPELYLTAASINNPNGKVDIDSKGSIWVNDSNVNARDISIRTDGSFFQGYQDGLVSTAGNPLGSGTDIYAKILDWINGKMLTGGGTVNTATLLANKTTAETALKGEVTQASWDAVYGAGGSGDTTQLVSDTVTAARTENDTASNDYKSKTTDLTNAETALKNSGKAFQDLVTNYSTVFDEDGNLKSGKSLNDLTPKTVGENENAAPADLTSAKSTYNSNATAVTEATKAKEDSYVVLSAKSKEFNDAADALQSKITAYARATTLYANATASTGTTSLVGTLTAYNNAIIALQDACTTASWNTVFGPGAELNQDGTRKTNLLVAKNGNNDSLEPLKTTYGSTKTSYESAISRAASSYVVGNISNYGDRNKSLAGNTSSQDVISTALPQNNGGTIYGGRSVFISAEMLNVNGTIKSGSLNYNIDLASTAVQNAISNATGNNVDITDAVFGQSNGSVRPKIILNKTDGTIVIDDVQAMGGDITLYGNIISTGNGKLEVCDGYGNISITGNSGYDLVLGRVDTGLGAEGTIRIVDTSKRDNVTNTPYTTVYTRAYESGRDVVYVEQGYGQSLTKSVFSGTAYQPTENRWLKTIRANNYTLRWESKYNQNVGVAFGGEIDFLGKDSTGVGSISGSATVSQSLPTGTYLVTRNDGIWGSSSNVLVGEFTRTASTPQLSESGWDRTRDDVTWGFGSRTYTKTTTTTQNYTERFDTYLNASQPIAIAFTGSQSASDADVSITGAKSVTLRDLIRAADTVSITSNGNIAGLIDSGTPAKTPAINAANVILDAKGNIGTYSTLANARNSNVSPTSPLEIESANGGTTLRAVALNGTTYKDINIALTGNRLLIDYIKGKDVKIESAGDILMKDDTNTEDGIVATGNLELTTDSGKIAGEAANSDFKFDVSGITTLLASGDIRANFANDLYVNQIISEGGDIYLTVARDILDSNSYEVDDPHSDYAAKQTFWRDIGLTAGAANTAKNNNIIAAYENSKKQEYFDVWKTLGYDIENYNPNYAFSFTADERNGLSNAGWSDQQIAAEEQRRTENYRTVTENGTASFNANYSYTATAAEKTELTRNSTWRDAQLANNVAAGVFLMFNDAGERQNTTSTIEEPNISGRNITITAGGNIGKGESDAAVEINRATGFNLTDQQLRALADAEYDDVTFYNNSNQVITDVAGAGTNAVKKIVIKRYDNVNIEATGNVKLQSGSGWTNVGSQSDIVIDNSTNGQGIKAGTNGDKSLRLKTDGAIRALNNSNVAIYARNAVLEAAGGTLGTSETSPLRVNLTGGNAANGWITARGSEGVYLDFVNASKQQAAAYIREVSSQDDIYLKATSFTDALPTSSAAKIGGKDIVLIATAGSIGTANDWLPILQIEGGSISLDASGTSGNIYVENPTSSFNITRLVAGGSVGIKAADDIFISGIFTANANNATASLTAGGDVTIEGITITINKALNISAGEDISVLNAILNASSLDFDANNGQIVLDRATLNIASGAIDLNAKTDLIVTGGTFRGASANLVTGRDISFAANTNVNVTGQLKALANRNLTLQNITSFTAGSVDFDATTGKISLDNFALTVNGLADLNAKTDLTLKNGSFSTTGNTTLIAGNDILLDNIANATVNGTLTATATRDLTLQNITTKLTAGSANLNAGRNILLDNITSATVTGALKATAGTNLTLEDITTLTAGTLDFDATAGLISLDRFALTVNGLADLNAKTDLTLKNGSFTVQSNGNAKLIAGRDIKLDTLTNASVAGALTVTATNDLTLEKITTLSAASAALNAKNISLDTIATATITNALTATATNDLTLKNVTTKLTAGSAALNAKNISLDTIASATVTGALKATAANNLTLENITTLTAGTLELKATAGLISLDRFALTVNGNADLNAKTDLTLKNGSFKVETTNKNANLTAGNNILLDTISALNVTGKLTAKAENDLTLKGITSSTLGSLDFDATTGEILLDTFALTVNGFIDINAKTDLTLSNGSFSSGTYTTLTAGNDIELNNIANATVTGALTATATNDLTLKNITTKLTAGSAALNAKNISLDTIQNLTVTNALTATATNDLTLKNVRTLSAKSATLNAENISLDDFGTATVTNALIAKAENDLTLHDIDSLTAGTLDFDAEAGAISLDTFALTVNGLADLNANTDLTLKNGSFKVQSNGNANLTAGGNILLDTIGTSSVAGKLTAKANNNLTLQSITGLTAGTLDFVATTGAISLDDFALTVNGQADLNAKTDLTLKNGSFTVAASNKNANLTAGSNILLDTISALNVTGKLTATAENNLTLKGITSSTLGSLEFDATTGEILLDDFSITASGHADLNANTDLTLTNGTLFKAASATLKANNNISLDTITNADVTGALNVTAGEDITLQVVTALKAGSATLEADNITLEDIGTATVTNNLTATAEEDLTLEDVGTLKANDAKLNAKNISLTDIGTATVTNTLTATAEEDLTLEDAGTLSAKNATLNAENISLDNIGNATITNALTATATNDLDLQKVTALSAGSASLKAENITLDDIGTATVTNALTVDAGTDLTLNKITALSAGSATLEAGNDISIDDIGTATVQNALTADAGTDLTLNKITELSAGSADLDADNNISITNVGDATVTDALTAEAGNDLTLQKIASLKAGTLDFDAVLGKIVFDNFKVDVSGALSLTAKTDLTLSNGGLFKAASANLTAEENGILLDKVTASIANKLTAKAAKDIELKSTTSTVGSQSLTSGRDIIIDNATNQTITNTFDAVAANDIKIGGTATVKGNSLDNGRSLILTAGNDLVSNGLITVEKGSVVWTATEGSIIDGNDSSTAAPINLVAAGLDVKMTSKHGIGSTNAFELNAKSLDLKVTDAGNIVIDALTDTRIINAVTQDGHIDIYSGGTMKVKNIVAGGTGHDVLLGAKNDIRFEASSKLSATNKIFAIAETGNIFSEATSESGAARIHTDNEAYLVAYGIGDDETKGHIKGNGADDMFIADMTGKIHLVAERDILVYNIHNADFNLGNVLSGDSVMIVTPKDVNLTFDYIVTKKIEVDADSVGIKTFADGILLSLYELMTSERNPSNNDLLDKDVELKIVGEISISNPREGGLLELGELNISKENEYVITGDNLVIDEVIANEDSAISHIGVNGTAMSTEIGNIHSDYDFTLDKLYSDNVTVFSDDINGSLIVNDGRSKGDQGAAFDINGVTSRVDAVTKTRTEDDFRIWTLDEENAGYNLVSNFDGIDFTNPFMRAVAAYNNYLLMNNHAYFTDSANEQSFAEMSPRSQDALDTVLQRTANQAGSAEILEIITGNPFTESAQNNNSNNNSTPTTENTGIKDEEEEEEDLTSTTEEEKDLTTTAGL